MSEFELRRRLAQLPRERDPQHDLWPAVAARLPAASSGSRRGSRRLAGHALAASVLVAVTLALLPESLRRHQPVLQPEHEMLLRQADSLAAEYRGALHQLGDIEFPPELAPALHDIDSSLLALHQALQSDPGAEFLLEHLRRAYAQRLRLSQRAISDWT